MGYVEEFRRLHYTPHLEEIAEPWAVQYIRPAVNGDEDAALSLCYALANGKRGLFAVAFWRMQAPPPAFRCFLSEVWSHDHRHLIAAAGTRRTLRAMFRYADFPKPDHLPDHVPIWRGTSKLTARQSARGLAWTTDRDCACWFAMRFADTNGRPLVLRAETPRESIALFTDDRSESEAVVFDIRDPVVDGGPQDWSAGYGRTAAASRRRTAAFLNENRLEG